MRFVNVSKLKRIGSGYFSTVYRLSPQRVIKVYNHHKGHDGNIMAEEVELSGSSPHALPVLGVAIAVKGATRHYAVIKKYIPRRATWKEADDLRDVLPRKLQADCYSDNVRKDDKGRLFLIDTQGNYAFKNV